MIQPRVLLLLPLATVTAACADEAVPRADPAQVERLVANQEAEQALPPAVAKKIHKADRISGTVLKVSPEKVDPDVAVALIAR